MVPGRLGATITTLNSKGLILSPKSRVSEGAQVSSLTKPQAVPLLLEGRACRSLQSFLWVASTAKL